MRILVVEDEPILADGLKVGLGLAGATADLVGCCCDARSALAAVPLDAATAQEQFVMARFFAEQLLPACSGLLGAATAGTRDLYALEF